MDKIDGMPQTPGDFILELLAGKNWSRGDLSFVLGVPANTVSELVCNRRGISPTMAKALGAALDVDPVRFLEAQYTWRCAKGRLEPVSRIPNPLRPAGVSSPPAPACKGDLNHDALP